MIIAEDVFFFWGGGVGGEQGNSRFCSLASLYVETINGVVNHENKCRNSDLQPCNSKLIWPLFNCHWLTSALKM